MGDQVDVDVLSSQLENSMSLEEEVDDHLCESISEKHQIGEGGDVKKILLESINALHSPIKINCQNLRKKVLNRNIQSTNLDIAASDIKTDKISGKTQKEKANEDEPVNSETSASAKELKTSATIFDRPKISDNLSEEDILSQDYIVIDDFLTFPPKSAKKQPIEEIESTQKVVKRSGLDVDYVSKDPLENADNNNPDWLLLQKLETDEERYKAVRARWRNLIVPEPNKDLTCFTWCRNRFTDIQKREDREDGEFERDQFKGRKRTFSSSEIESPRRGRQRENSEKRVRTLSCTRVYDEKLAALRRHVSEECLKIDKEQKRALDELNNQYINERRSLSSWSLSRGLSISATLNDLEEYHYQQRRNIKRSYEDLSLKFLEKQSAQIRSLEDASAEVIAFHCFYQGLDQCAPEAIALTEEQSQEIDEINHMYDAFYKFYGE